MKSLFVMDPLDRLHIAGDSTYVLMRECCDRGLPVHYCTPETLFARDGVAGAICRPVKVNAAPPLFDEGPEEERSLGDFDVVWMRKDPPFDMHYIFSCYVLEMAPRGTLVVNDPAGLVRLNEKLWAMSFADIHPPTLLSRDPAQIRAFVARFERAVLKPWDGNGGRGVVITRKGDRNLNALIELLTADGRLALLAQRYVDAIAEGDKRILLFDGEPVGAVMRIPGAEDHRGNMHVGARVEKTEITEEDRAICARLGPHLKAAGMLFVGIDVIGRYLTEINVTSPTGIREINRLDGRKLEADLVDLVLARVAGGEGS